MKKLEQKLENKKKAGKENDEGNTAEGVADFEFLDEAKPTPESSKMETSEVIPE